MPNQQIIEALEAEWNDRLKAAVEDTRQQCADKAKEVVIRRWNKGAEFYGTAEAVRQAVLATARQNI